jgi:hypothetical protein
VTTVQRVLRRIGWHPEQLLVRDNASINRFIFVPAAIINHMCLGGVFAWSMFNEPITHLHGVVAPAVADWTLSQTSMTFSLIMGGFVWGAFVAKYFVPWGPRFTCSLGALSLGVGFAVAASALTTGSLPLLYLGGGIWGLSLAWSYVPPVDVLLKWYPDRKGFASGGCILGFGAGSAVAAVLIDRLLLQFRRAPDRLGAIGEFDLSTGDSGALFVQIGDQVMARDSKSTTLTTCVCSCVRLW